MLVGPLGWLMRIEEHHADDALPAAPNYRRRFLAQLAVSAVATPMLILTAVLPDTPGPVDAARARAYPAVQVGWAPSIANPGWHRAIWMPKSSR